MQRVYIEAAGLIAKREQRAIVPDDLRELGGYRREQLVSIQLRHERIGDVEQRSQPVPLPDCRFLCQKDSTATANSLAMRSRNAISAGLGSICATELKPNAPSRLFPVVSGTSIRVVILKSRARLTNSGQRVSERSRWDDERPLVQPYPTGWILVDRQPKAGDDGIAGLIQDVPLHGVAGGIVQNERDMIETDNLTERFGGARQETSEICATGDGTRKLHDGLIECIAAGAVLTADPDDGIPRCDGLDLVPAGRWGHRQNGTRSGPRIPNRFP